MNTFTPLKSALLSFFQTGVMPPHRSPGDYEAPRPSSADQAKRRRTS